MSLPDIIRTYWPIATFITPFLLAGGFAWLRMQFPTKGDLEKLRTDREKALGDMRGEVAREIAETNILARATADRQIAAEQTLKALQRDLGGEPSRVGLSKDIGKVAERLGRVESGVEHQRQQMATLNGYLHTLLEKHLK